VWWVESTSWIEWNMCGVWSEVMLCVPYYVCVPTCGVVVCHVPCVCCHLQEIDEGPLNSPWTWSVFLW